MGQIIWNYISASSECYSILAPMLTSVAIGSLLTGFVIWLKRGK